MSGGGTHARRVVMTGTFDVRNYGDLLFPLLAAQRLAGSGIEVVPASPTGRPTGWQDTMPPVSLGSALFGEERFDGVLIGGGNIIHARPVKLPDYAEGDMARWAYGSLWLGATLAAARRGVPVVWNAPGVPGAFEAGEADMVQLALAAASRVAVRDAASAGWLEPFPADVVPDTALDLARLWPKRELEDTFRKLLARKGVQDARHYVAIHVKRRSVDGEVESIAPLIDAFGAGSGRMPILIGIGQCHDDHHFTQRLANAVALPCINLSEPEGLREIAAAIAWSDGYVGASMHGYVTAAAYGVPGVIVGKPRIPKMQGLLSQLGREADEAADWAAALDLMRPRIGAPAAAIPASVHAALDRHWNAVGQALAVDAVPAVAQAIACRRAELSAFVPSAAA